MIHGHYQLELKEGGETMQNWQVIFWLATEVQGENEGEALKAADKDFTEELQQTKIPLVELFHKRVELLPKE